MLLPDNTDPWKKVPDNIPEKKNLCTYLEMRGDYEDDGIKVTDMGFRMYLGNDATTDFDIVRNTAYTVTAGINDKATAEMLSWKVVSGSKDYKRKLSWSPNPDTLFCGKTLTVTPNLGVTQKSTKFDFSFEGLDGLGVTYSRTGNTLKFTSSKQFSEAKKFYVTATTADGRHSAKLTVVLQPLYPVKLKIKCDEYMSGSEQSPVWKIDWYYVESAGKEIVPFSVIAVYNDMSEINVASSCTNEQQYISGNAGAGNCFTFNNGKIEQAGSGSTETGGNGTVRFSYSENGKTVAVTAIWWKLYPVQLRFAMDSLVYPGISGDDWFYYRNNDVFIVYQDDIRKNIGKYGLGKLMSSDDNLLHFSEYFERIPDQCWVYAMRRGNATIYSENRFRGLLLQQNVVCCAASSISLSPDDYLPYNPDQPGALSSYITPGYVFYPAYEDVDGGVIIDHAVTMKIKWKNPSGGVTYKTVSCSSISAEAVYELFDRRRSDFPGADCDIFVNDQYLKNADMLLASWTLGLFLF